MIVFYSPTSYSISHVVFEAADEYMRWLEDPATVHSSPYVIIPERMALEEIEILPGPTWRRRAPIDIVAPTKGRVGEEFTIANVPKDVTIFLDEQELGVMDSSGILELVLETAANYRLRLAGPGYIAKEIEIEVLP